MKNLPVKIWEVDSRKINTYQTKTKEHKESCLVHAEKGLFEGNM